MKEKLEKLGFKIVDETENFFYMTLDRLEDDMIRDADDEILQNLIYSYREPTIESRDYDYKFPKHVN